MLLRLTCIPSANQSIQLIVTSTPNPSITAMERFALRIDNKIAKIGARQFFDTNCMYDLKLTGIVGVVDCVDDDDVVSLI